MTRTPIISGLTSVTVVFRLLFSLMSFAATLVALRAHSVQRGAAFFSSVTVHLAPLCHLN